MLGIHIEIQEIVNGFVVHFFSEEGDAIFDKSIYCATIADVIIAIQNWVKKVRKKGS